ncbi:MAG: hypothetical protein MJ188_09775 [Treponema sp.]|nr:hypothetical protein [Treponema sp.]
MKRRSIFVFLATSLAILIPAPGRFIYGFVLMLEFNLVMLVGTLLTSLVKKIKLNDMMTIIILFGLLSFTILFRQIIILINPEIILTIGFLIYVIPVSFVTIGYIFNEDLNIIQKAHLKNRLRLNMLHSLTYSLFGLLFFLIRDLAGYGTFTFFGKNHQIMEKVIIDSDKLGFFTFIASIPGALLMSSIFLFLYVYIRNRIDMIQKIEG